MQTSAKNLSLSPSLVRFRFKIQYCQKFNRIHTLQYIKFSRHSLSNYFLMKEGEFLLSSLCMLYVQMPASKDPTTPPTKRCRLSLLTNSALIIESQ